MRILLLIGALCLAASGCVSQHDQMLQMANYSAGLRAQCHTFGYQEGSTELAQCLERATARAEYTRMQWQLEKSRQNAAMWQNNKPVKVELPSLSMPPIPPNRRINCTSNRVGNQVYTNCY